MFVFHGLHRADDEPRGEELAAEGFGELDTDGVFAGHGEAENVDRARAEPVFEKDELLGGGRLERLGGLLRLRNIGLRGLLRKHDVGLGGLLRLGSR